MFSKEKLNIEAIDVIFNRMLETIMNSKDDIFVISEQSRRSFEDMQKELQTIRGQIKIVIHEGDYLDLKVKQAKQRLVSVSKDFNRYSEQQVKEA